MRIRAGSNLLYTCLEQVVRLATTFLIGVWLARALGAEALGVIAFALSVIALPKAIAPLGLNLILKREWIKQPGEVHKTLATAFWMRLGTGCVFMAVVVALAFAYTQDSQLRVLLVLLSLTLLVPPFESFELFFQNRLEVKATVAVRMTAAVAAFILSLILVLSEAPLGAFGTPYVLEGAVIAAGFLGLYLRTHPPKAWYAGCLRVGASLIRESWAPLFSALLAIFILQADHYFLKVMLGTESLGIYSAAARLDKMVYFFPTAAVAVFFPLLMGKPEKGGRNEAETVLFLRFLFLVAGVFYLVALISAPVVIPLVYGGAFESSIRLWQIHALTVPLFFLVSARGSYVARHKLFFNGLSAHLISAIALMGLLYVLVGSHGVEGAAWAVVIALFINGVIIPLLDPKLRPFLRLAGRALFLPV